MIQMITAVAHKITQHCLNYLAYVEIREIIKKFKF
jgi:hypothetical protein